MEGCGGKAAFSGNDWRVAWGAGRDALFPAQDKEDRVPGWILGDCDGVAGVIVGAMDRAGMRVCEKMEEDTRLCGKTAIQGSLPAVLRKQSLRIRHAKGNHQSSNRRKEQPHIQTPRPTTTPSPCYRYVFSSASA